MLNLEQFVENIGNILRPHAEDLRKTVDAQLCRIVARLDDIAEGVNSEEWSETMHPTWTMVTANETKDLVTVPAGARSALAVVGVMEPCTVTITDEGSFIFVKQFSAADTAAPNIRLRPGARIEVVTTGNADPVKVFTMVRSEHRPPVRQAHGAGHVRQLPDEKPDESTGRHVQPGVIRG